MQHIQISQGLKWIQVQMITSLVYHNQACQTRETKCVEHNLKSPVKVKGNDKVKLPQINKVVKK